MAVISGDDYKNVTAGLLKGGFQFTTLASTGGFLKVKSVTLLCGVRNERTEEVLEIIKSTSGSKKVSSAHLSDAGRYLNVATDIPSEYTFGGATVFVMDIEKFLKF